MASEKMARTSPGSRNRFTMGMAALESPGNVEGQGDCPLAGSYNGAYGVPLTRKGRLEISLPIAVLRRMMRASLWSSTMSTRNGGR